MSVAIDCQNLSKRYGHSPTYALKNLTLQVNPGEIYGFIGPNGAGKSTTIRTLLNFIQPSSGRASIAGLDIVKDSLAIKRKIGYLAGEVELYRRMSGQQFLDYMSAIQPLKNRQYLKDLIRTFGVNLNQPISSLSKGNRQKLGVVQAFMHEPEVLILDEPTSGLDPLMQEAFYELVEQCKQRGAAIFLSSHDLTEVRKMCDRIGFIRGGQLVTEQAITDLQKLSAQTFDITFKQDAPLEALKKLPGCKVQSSGRHSVTVRFSGDLSGLFGFLARYKVVTIDRHDVDLEEEFLQFYKAAGAGGAK